MKEKYPYGPREQVNTTLSRTLYADLKKLAKQQRKNTNELIEEGMIYVIVKNYTKKYYQDDKKK